MTRTIAVVIPALDEAERLPRLLGMLHDQTRAPDEIIVADAGSTDGTARVARDGGAHVVAGGRPAAGRNAGAAAATAEVILFLDADVEPADDFVTLALAEFEDRGLAVATALVEPLEREPVNIMATEVVNLYLDVMQYVAPHAPGFCILVDRSVHEAIGGFDETVVLAEDHDYVQRAAERGKFRVLRSARITTSMRRIEKEGLVRLAFMYLYCELYAVTGTPIRKVPFEYEFASFAPEEREAAMVSVSALRGRLSRVADTFMVISAPGREALLRLGTIETGPQRFEQLVSTLAPRDVKTLRRYLRIRLDAAKAMPPKAVEGLRAIPGHVRRQLTSWAE